MPGYEDDAEAGTIDLPLEAEMGGGIAGDDAAVSAPASPEGTDGATILR